MINVDLQQLVQALDADSRRDLEAAAERCVRRGGSKVLIEDLLDGLLNRADSLLVRALQDADGNADALAAVLHPRPESGETANPVFSTELVQWLQDALLIASLELSQSQIDAAALILALLRNPLRYAGTRYMTILGTLNADRLCEFARAQQPAATAPGTPRSDESALQRFTHNFTQQARDSKLDPVLCRDGAIRQMIDILARRRKNNPIVVGEAGVGKTAIVEGLALRIAQGEVPTVLQNTELLCLDMGLLQAGASIKGEFERRLQGVIDEVKASAQAIILFIDEAHTLIGAGGQAGGSDAANLLKPALARGELRTIAATTWSEYKKYFEKDPALARRFQPVQLHEPTVNEAVTILRGLAPVYEQSHGVYLRDDAVVAAAELSARYLAGRQLPDKAVDVLDTACARVRINLAAAPESIERLRQELAEGERQCDAMQRDQNAGLSIDTETLDHLENRLLSARSELNELQHRWEAQRGLALRLLELRKKCAAARQENIEANPETAEQPEPGIPLIKHPPAGTHIAGGPPRRDAGRQASQYQQAQGQPANPGRCADVVAARRPSYNPERLGSTTEDRAKTLAELETQLRETQAELIDAQAGGVLVNHEVCPRLVAEVISHWTGIPLSQLARQHNARVATFSEDLGQRLRGQDQAINAMNRAIRSAAAGMTPVDAPTGVFLLAGPSGVGKTETALALADLLYGGERFLTTINMSEFQEKHSLSRLIGAPPGYVGYGEGGMLTEAVRQKPYSVILLDEVEKADPDVLNVFYQIFDKGVANDGEGREINFRNTLILLTSNLGSDTIIELCRKGEHPTAEQLEKAIRPALSRHFKPALLARMNVVPYFSVDGEVLQELVTLKLERFGQRLLRRHVSFSHTPELVAHFADLCVDSDMGARLIDQLIDRHLQAQTVDRLLDAMASGETLRQMQASLNDQGRVVCDFA